MYVSALKNICRQNARRLSWWAMVVLLGGAIGASVAITVIFDAVALHPLPGRKPEEILALGGLAYGAGMADPVDWWHQAAGIEDLALYRTGDVECETGEQPSARWIRATEVSGDFFDLFGITPDSGRLLTREDERSDLKVAVVRPWLWNRIREQTKSAEPQTIRLNGATFQVVGVIPRAFTFPSVSDVWVPRARTESLRLSLADGVAGLPPVRSRTGWIARPRVGVSAVQIENQLQALLVAANKELFPKTGIRYGEIVAVGSLFVALTETVRPNLELLLAGSLLILLLALANAVIFNLTRLGERRREISIKASLGASPAMVRLELLLDIAMMLVTALGVSVLAAVGYTNIARLFLASFRAYVPAWSVILPSTVISSLLCGVAFLLAASIPSWFASRSLSPLDSRTNTLNSRSTTAVGVVARRSFVAIASALSMILIVGAALTDRVLVRLTSTELGHATSDVTSARLVFQRTDLAGPKFIATRQEIMTSSANNGVVAIASAMPITANQLGFIPVSSGATMAVMASALSIDGKYFEVLKIPVAIGSVGSLSSDTVVLSRSLAQRLFPDSQSVGSAVTVNGKPKTVVAIVDDTRTFDQGDKTVYQIYRTFEEVDASGGQPSFALEVLLRCPANCTPDRVAATMTTIQHAHLARVDSLEGMISLARQGSTIAASLWSVYATLAIGISLLASSSLVGLSVRRRRAETGIRLVLGASGMQIVFGLASEGILAVTLGTTLGAIAVYVASGAMRATTRVLEQPGIPVLLLSAASIILAGAVAAILPALSATRTTPLSLLTRAE